MQGLSFILTETGSYALLVPFCLGFLLSYWAPGRRPHMEQALTILLAFGFAFNHLRPQPLFPAIGGIGHIPIAGLIGLGLALILSFSARANRLPVLVVMALGLPPIIALTIQQVTDGPFYQAPLILTLGLLITAGIWIGGRLVSDLAKPNAAPLALISATAALALVAWIYGSRISWHMMALCSGITATYIGLLLARKPWAFGASLTAFALYFAGAVTLFLSRTELVLPVGITALGFFLRPIMDFMVPSHMGVRIGGQVVLSVGAVTLAALSAIYFT